SGDYERHIRRMRRLYRTRRDALLAALIRHFGDRVDVGPRHGGLNLLVELDAPGTSEEIATRALACGLAVRPATQYYSRPPARPMAAPRVQGSGFIPLAQRLERQEKSLHTGLVEDVVVAAVLSAGDGHALGAVTPPARCGDAPLIGAEADCDGLTGMPLARE